MFASPAIRIFSQENTEVAPRKPATDSVNRKALFDRTVNAATPKVNSTQNSKSFFKKQHQMQVEKEEEDLFNYDFYTPEDINNNMLCDDVTPLKTEDTIKILKAYCGYESKTPEFNYSRNLDLFMKMPKFEPLDFEPLLCPVEQNVEDVILPKMDF